MMFCVAVHLTIRAESWAEFMPLMQANARTSLTKEPGCHRFDICTDPDQPGAVFLYELYTDKAAFEAHLATNHFLTFDAQTADMVIEKTVKTYAEVRS